MSKQYMINEVFYSLQGEGVRAGTPNVFVRFTGCNLRCSMEPGEKSPGGFDCDTEFASGRKLTLDELADLAAEAASISTGMPKAASGLQACSWWEEPWLILTGGEPGLQVDEEFVSFWHHRCCRLAIETNGTVCLPKWPGDEGDGFNGSEMLDWITLSPKVAEHAVKQLWADEVKYVRGFGQGIPRPAAKADHYLLSPAADGAMIDPRTIDWCMKLCLQNPQWRLSCQQHKTWKVR